MVGKSEKIDLFLKNLVIEAKKKCKKKVLPWGGLEPAILVLLVHSLDHYANERLVGEWSEAFLYKVWVKALNVIFSVIGPNRLSIFWYIN